MEFIAHQRGLYLLGMAYAYSNILVPVDVKLMLMM